MACFISSTVTCHAQGRFTQQYRSHRTCGSSPRAGPGYGDDAIFAHTFPAEFRQLQAHYPIVFRRSPDGATFEAFALFGFETCENLFLGADGWQASYVPLAIERQPFLIGVGADGLSVHVDIDSPRLSKTEGEAVFMPHGSPTLSSIA